MSDAVEDGATLAWRLLATLEGGTVLLASSALLAYTAKNKFFHQNRSKRTVRNVLVTNTSNLLGRELKRRLEERGCVVETATPDSGVTNGANNPASSEAGDKVDALVMIGAELKTNNLDNMANFVTEDIHNNLKLLESMSSRVHEGGYIAWACSRDSLTPVGTFRDAGEAFDTVLKSSLQHLAKIRHCEPIWTGRCESTEKTAEVMVATLLNGATQHTTRFFFRYTARRIGEYLDRWLKIIT